MLSYQHIYHAGGWADLHKHGVLCALWDVLAKRFPALVYGDTHAGRGVYDLSAPEAQKRREYESGVVRLSGQRLPQSLSAYRTALEYWMPLYAGSPGCVAALMRPADRQFLCELHPQELAHLQRNLGTRAGVQIFKQNGHEALLAHLPKDMAGLVLIDPSYEVKTEYEQTVQTALALRERFPDMVVLVWYPVLLGRELHSVLEEGLSCGVRSVFTPPDAPEKGMIKSGLIALGAPDGFSDAMRNLEKDLRNILSDGKERHHE